MIAAEDVLSMDVNEIVETIEQKTGKPVSSSFGLWLAVAHGSARAGSSLSVIDLNRGENRKETVDYEELAKLFNQPDVPKEPRPPFSLRIPCPDHFLEAYAEAEKVGGRAFEKFKEDILMLLKWAMRQHRNELTIGPDFVPHSFYWGMRENGKLVFNGGLIKHGEGEDASWSIHT